MWANAVAFRPSLVALACSAALLPACSGCGSKGTESADGAAPTATATAAATQAAAPGTPARPGIPSGPVVAAIAYDVPVFEKPSRSSKKLGSLRVGAIVSREEKSAGTDGCPAPEAGKSGWFRIEPRGYVCVGGEEATTDVQNPIVRAASVRPDTTRPLPYMYGFVRAVAPQYLKVPTAEEQQKSEFKLKEHLESYEKHGPGWMKVVPGANDVALSWLPASPKPSTELGLGQLFGATADFDPVPFWLVGGRKIPNLSTFKVPPYAIFANRVRRKTGLAFVGAFKGGPEAADRAFAITTDMRLVPVTKLKPDTGSPWHGIDIDDKTPLPFAFVRQGCALRKDKKKSDECTPFSYRIDGDTVHKDKALTFRSVVRLTGKAQRVGDKRYREMVGGGYALASDLGAIMEPQEWPKAATSGEKWIEVSILNQTLTLWEGKKPVYATLVATGQDGLGDPKTTKSTVRGTFRIRNKFVSATMDSNEKSGASGGAAAAEPAGPEKDKGDKPEKGDKGDKGEEGKTIRRGQNNFELRDVPYVQYFEGAFALHVAYWHDVFGLARSHGCVNLAPIDGQKLYRWTDPQVPPGWHSVEVNGDKGGTTVVVHE